MSHEVPNCPRQTVQGSKAPDIESILRDTDTIVPTNIFVKTLNIVFTISVLKKIRVDLFLRAICFYGRLWGQ